MRARVTVGLLRLLCLGLLTTVPRPVSAQEQPDASSATAASGSLQTLLGQLVSSDRNMRRAAARSIDTLGRSATPAMAAILARQRPGRPPAEVSALLSLSGARTHQAADAAPADRLDALLDLPPDSGPAYIQAVTTLCLVRALSDIATPDAVAALAGVALDAHGAFLPDVRRHLTALGERATAGLVLLSHGHAGDPASRWASSELELLGTRTPGDAVQTKNKEVLADILVAYGTVADADALPVVMSFVNADKKLVRDAAREGVTRYGDQAMPKLREAYGLLTGEGAPPDWPAPWLRRKLFEALDAVRLEDVDTRVRSGLALAQDGHFAEAVASFDDVLARQPDWDRKAELVPAYVFYAQAIKDADPNRARELLEKALHLDPSGPRSAQIESTLALLEGQELARHGIEDEEPFRRALALDPTNVAASDALLRFADEARGRKKAWDHRFWLGGVALALASALILFVGRRRGSSAPSRAHMTLRR